MSFTFRGLHLELVLDDAWEPVADEDVARWRHPSGLSMAVKWRDGARSRLEVDILPAADIASAPAPRLHVASEHPLIAWLGGAGAQIVAVTPQGPILVTQQRGYATGEPADMGLFPEPLVIAPGHPASSVLVFEQLDGDRLDVPAEPHWFPARRHVPVGEEIELEIPDGVVTGVDFHEADDGFLLVGEPGLHTARVGGPTGITQLEVGWFKDWHELVDDARSGGPDDLWCYLTTLLPRGEAEVDELDVRLAAALETPTLWAAMAAARAVDFGLPTFDDARAAA
ncbi:MAG: hypothetical protein GX596_12930, partial [Propionibacterium sp.]|nr:hypothetical protein [Propionibacterium sp.]